MGLSEQYLLGRAIATFQRHKNTFPELLREPLYIRGKDGTEIEIPLTRFVPNLTLNL